MDREQGRPGADIDMGQRVYVVTFTKDGVWGVRDAAYNDASVCGRFAYVRFKHHPARTSRVAAGLVFAAPAPAYRKAAEGNREARDGHLGNALKFEAEMKRQRLKAAALEARAAAAERVTRGNAPATVPASGTGGEKILPKKSRKSSGTTGPRGG